MRGFIEAAEFNYNSPEERQASYRQGALSGAREIMREYEVPQRLHLIPNRAKPFQYYFAGFTLQNYCYDPESPPKNPAIEEFTARSLQRRLPELMGAVTDQEMVALQLVEIGDAQATAIKKNAEVKSQEWMRQCYQGTPFEALLFPTGGVGKMEAIAQVLGIPPATFQFSLIEIELIADEFIRRAGAITEEYRKLFLRKYGTPGAIKHASHRISAVYVNRKGLTEREHKLRINEVINSTRVIGS